MISITVNGKAREIEDEATVDALLRTFEINPRLVAVAINGEVVPRDTYESARVRRGDAIEIVRMVGGGAR